MGFWADKIGGGNSFTQSVKNAFTPNNDTQYVKGNLETIPNNANRVAANSMLSVGVTSLSGNNSPDPYRDPYASTAVPDNNSGGGGGGGGQAAGASTFAAGPAFDIQTIIDFASKVGMAGSDAELKAITDDPAGWLEKNGALLDGKVDALDPETIGTLLDTTKDAYTAGDTNAVEVTTVDDISTADEVTNTGAETYTASTTEDLLGTEETTVDAVTGEIRDENLVDAEQIDMTGAGTGVNADNTVNETGEALNDYASINISTMIDTSTVAGKLLSDKLTREGKDFVDAKTSVLWQMKTIAAEFTSPSGDPIIPPWAQGLARDVSKTIAFSGISGTAANAAMSNAIMESMLGVAEKESTFYQTLTTKNLDNKQQAIINKANVMSKFELANLDARQAAAVQNAKAFLEMDLTNLTNEQQAEVINTQAMVDALFNDQSAINAARLFGAEQSNDMQKYYDNMNAQISLQNSEQRNLMKKFNAGEKNDGAEFNAKLEQSREEFYANMQYNLDLANAKWRQSVATTNTEMEFEAATIDVRNTLDISTEAMTRMWDRVDNMLDYVFKGWNAEADRDAKILATEINAQANSGSGGNSFIDGLFTLGAAYITAGSDKRMKTNIQYYDTIRGNKYYTWEWNSKAKEIGWDRYPTFGVIAQQVQKKYPHAVSTGKDGYLMVNYGEIQ
tara:strand:+ start:2712 stop:4739 length:2028 start_codon:yes stop_codon:yes gene_type:complete